MNTCSHCGTRNDGQRLRCAVCGAPCSAPARPAAVAPSGVRATRDTLRTTRSALEADRAAPPPSAQTRVPVGPQEALGAWLAADVLDKPYPLHRTFPVNIGRGTENHIVLPVQQVSRLHATIQWSKDAFEIIDRGSMNGTRVNGELVARRRMTDADSIRIGPIEFVFGTKAAESARPTANDTAHDWGPVVGQSSFVGVLAHLKLPEVWQMLELGHKTGRLVIQHGDQRGAIYFAQGRVVHAELGALVGEPAAIALLVMNTGTFRFLPSASIDAERTIHRAPTSILLEAARLADENTREDEATGREVA
jgi:hypothetical protein